MTETAGPVLVLERDLFFLVKVREPLRLAGQTVVTVKGPDDLQAALRSTPTPRCLVVHVGVPGVDWSGAITAAHTAGIPILAYGSHVDHAAQTTARAAGATRVIPNAKLAEDIAGQVEATIARAHQHAPASIEEDETDAE